MPNGKIGEGKIGGQAKFELVKSLSDRQKAKRTGKKMLGSNC